MFSGNLALWIYGDLEGSFICTLLTLVAGCRNALPCGRFLQLTAICATNAKSPDTMPYDALRHNVAGRFLLWGIRLWGLTQMALKGGPGVGTVRKGSRFEGALVRLLKGVGLGAKRVPRSGAAGGVFAGDVAVEFPEGTAIRGIPSDIRIEAKCRASGFREIYGWLGDKNFAVCAKSDYHETLITLRMRHAAAIVEAFISALQQIRALQARVAALEEGINGTEITDSRRNRGDR